MLTDSIFAVSNRRIAIHEPQSDVSASFVDLEGQFEVKTIRTFVVGFSASDAISILNEPYQVDEVDGRRKGLFE